MVFVPQKLGAKQTPRVEVLSLCPRTLADKCHNLSLHPLTSILILQKSLELGICETESNSEKGKLKHKRSKICSGMLGIVSLRGKRTYICPVYALGQVVLTCFYTLYLSNNPRNWRGWGIILILQNKQTPQTKKKPKSPKVKSLD